jgi:Rps23 Pro-64 3,4-dihydroxylase Tpa1-like proline 4-hydroxylase
MNKNIPKNLNSMSNLSKVIVEKLESNFDQLSKQFFSLNTGTTSKFFILDDLLPKEITTEIYESFPNKDVFDFEDSFREKKFTFKKFDHSKNSLINDITDSFQMDNVIKVIERITKTPHLTADPSLYAGGISRMDFGHFLNPHVDNSHDATRKRYRRFNLLFYVTPEIQESDGGNFELWDKGVKNPLLIQSKFNRLVVLETTQYSWHSVDHVLSNIQRCCVSNYYFSENSPENYEYYNVTSFVGRPDEGVKRFYGPIDNLLRNTFAKITGISRGKKLVRIKKS